MGAHHDWSDGKIRSEFQHRHQARDELVATVRKHGMILLAALVLLPAQLVGMGVICTVLYFLARRFLHNGRGRKPTAAM